MSSARPLAFVEVETSRSTEDFLEYGDLIGPRARCRFLWAKSPRGSMIGALCPVRSAPAKVQRCCEGPSCSFRSTPSNASAMTENSACTGVTRNNQDRPPCWCWPHLQFGRAPRHSRSRPRILIEERAGPGLGGAALALSERNAQVALVLEDPGGDTVDGFLSGSMEMTQFLRRRRRSCHGARGIAQAG